MPPDFPISTFRVVKDSEVLHVAGDLSYASRKAVLGTVGGKVRRMHLNHPKST